MASFLVPSAPAKDSSDYTRVYENTFDEAFQASRDTLQRMGMSFSDADKDKGVISGTSEFRCQCGGGPCMVKMAYDIHIEPVSPKPETRVTVNAKRKTHVVGMGGCVTLFKQEFLSELQKLLATYK